MKTTTTNNAVPKRREERNCYYSVEETSIVAVDELTTEKPMRKEHNKKYLQTDAHKKEMITNMSHPLF